MMIFGVDSVVVAMAFVGEYFVYSEYDLSMRNA
jgi:hypothetical protein